MKGLCLRAEQSVSLLQIKHLAEPLAAIRAPSMLLMIIHTVQANNSGRQSEKVLNDKGAQVWGPCRCVAPGPPPAGSQLIGCPCISSQDYSWAKAKDWGSSDPTSALESLELHLPPSPPSCPPLSGPQALARPGSPISSFTADPQVIPCTQNPISVCLLNKGPDPTVTEGQKGPT